MGSWQPGWDAISGILTGSGCRQWPDMAQHAGCRCHCPPLAASGALTAEEPAAAGSRARKGGPKAPAAGGLRLVGRAARVTVLQYFY